MYGVYSSTKTQNLTMPDRSLVDVYKCICILPPSKSSMINTPRERIFFFYSGYESSSAVGGAFADHSEHAINHFHRRRFLVAGKSKSIFCRQQQQLTHIFTSLAGARRSTHHRKPSETLSNTQRPKHIHTGVKQQPEERNVWCTPLLLVAIVRGCSR